MRTITWETASQITLRNCFREVERKVNIYVILIKGVYATKHTSKQKVTASHKGQMSLLMILVLF